MTLRSIQRQLGVGGERALGPSNSGTLVLDGYPSGYNSDVGCTDPEACNYDPELSPTTEAVRNLMRAACAAGTTPRVPDAPMKRPAITMSADVDDGSCIINGSVITFVLLTDNYPAETTWNITDASGSIVLEGGPYNGLQATYTSTVYLEPGCYTLAVNDSYGDGLQYNGVVGDYTLTDETALCLPKWSKGATLVTKRFTTSAWKRTPLKAAPTPPRAITTPAPQRITVPAFTPPAVITAAEQLTAPAAWSTATALNGVCDEDEIVGCQDEVACNFNPDATDAATCEFAADGFDCDGNPLSCAEDINGKVRSKCRMSCFCSRTSAVHRTAPTQTSTETAQ